MPLASQSADIGREDVDGMHRPPILALGPIAAAALVALVSLHPGIADEMLTELSADFRTDMTTDRTLPPPRDPELAVREEYELAVAAGTPEALRLFIKRHAGHPLAVEAERRLRAIGGDDAAR
jgi:hypothetical protein